MTTGRVFIIGGGLAGMTVAKVLLERGVAVTILDAADRLGGKAGADVGKADFGEERTLAVEHGYHIFPGWYRNTRALLRDLGIEDRLIDITRFHHLHRPSQEDVAHGRRGRLDTYYGLTSLTGAARSMLSTSLPWHQALVGMYFLVDLMAEPFSQRDYLDRISVNALLRSRFYRSRAIAEFHNENVLQAASTPTYDLSAMTLQNVAKSFLSNRQPMFSILDGNLQTTFIEPFARLLRRLGAKVRLKHPIGGLEVEDGRVSSCQRAAPVATWKTTNKVYTKMRASRMKGQTKNDWYVLATPPEEAARFANFIYPQELAVEAKGGAATRYGRPLSDVSRLRSAPMAAFQWYLEDKIPLPAEHINLYGSRYGISFIDISQHWRELEGEKGTVLSIIASKFEHLKDLSKSEQLQRLTDEIEQYLPDVRLAGEIKGSSNIEAPLFLNTTGAWPDRPRTRTLIENLFVAGDYCQNQADLTTMEGAVMSGLRTASDLLEAMGLDNTGVAPLPLHLLPRWQMVLAKYALFPLIAPIGVYNAFQREWERWTTESP